MQQLKKLAAVLFAVFIGLITFSGLSLAQSDTALVRFVHALSGAGAVDVYINGQPVAIQLGFGQASTLVQIPASPVQISASPTGTTTALWEQTFDAPAGTASALIVSSSEPLQFTAFDLDVSPLPLGRTRITAVHAIPDAPAVDVVLEDGRAVVQNLSYNAPYGALDIPALTYPLAVVPSGGDVSEALLPVTDFALASGTSYMVIAYGSATAPQALVLSAPSEGDADSGFVRIVHGVDGAPAVDVYVNGVLAVPGLAFGQSTGFIAVPEGDYPVSITAAGTSDAIVEGALSIAAGDYTTAAAIADGNDVIIQGYIDNVAVLDAQTAAFTVYHGVPGGDDLALSLSADGEDVGVTTVATAGEAAFTIFPATEGALTAQIEVGTTNEEVPLLTNVTYGGVYYSALAVSGEGGLQLIELPPASIAQTVGSAPGAVVATGGRPEAAVAQAATPTATVIPPVDATAVPAQVVQPTAPPAPTVPPAAPTLPPTAAPQFPTARVILDPGANLQLRQYPSRDAFSLGLAPSGTTLIVLGRAGDPALPVGVASPTPDPLVTPTVDPVALLPEDEDLNPVDVWLRVIYTTPDGGEVEAWVNAQFLDVRDTRGRLQRLADLPTVPSNEPGEARDTAIAPPPLPSDVVIVTVFNLDAGANLQIRRTPNTDGESLALVPNETALELVGVNEARDWAFVRYTPPTGGTITGWANLIFLEISFRDEPFTLDELEARGLLETIPDTERGAITAGAAGPAAPTVDPLRDVFVATVQLDAGANLHLRRNPNANSESLALIPSGSRLIVNGRIDTNDWVQVTFEGLEGWVSTQFLTFTFNENAVNLADIPITLSTISPTIDPLLITPTPGA
ncbi:MAG: DUF4397 domain-containing protein [Chloroflexota bacterium]|nr:DUF4397 domain-containing protein [Chloroflexota bacterium]